MTDPDPDHDDEPDGDRYRLLSGDLTRTTDDGDTETIEEGDVFVPTQSELDAFGDRMTLADNDNDANARETGHPMAVTGRSYRIMSNYDGRNLRPQNQPRSKSRIRAPGPSLPIPDNAEDEAYWEKKKKRDRSLTDHPQSEDQQDLPEQPDTDRKPSLLEQIFHPPKRSILSPGGPFHPATRGDTDQDDQVPLASDTDDAGTDTGLSVDEGVERIRTLARNYADNDYEMAHHEYEEALDDILSKMDVGDAVEALERVKVDQIRV